VKTWGGPQLLHPLRISATGGKSTTNHDILPDFYQRVRASLSAFPNRNAQTFAFILVCAGVWILRVRRPELPRSFKVAAVPVVSTLGILVCGAMIYGLGWTNWLRLGVWMVIGLVLYFSYGRSHSKLVRAGA
jgi:peptidoglycan/LPS O-acetylase OafA/YrhL